MHFLPQRDLLKNAKNQSSHRLIGSRPVPKAGSQPNLDWPVKTRAWKDICNGPSTTSFTTTVAAAQSERQQWRHGKS